MKKTILVLATAAALPFATAWAGSESSMTGEILGLERRALDGWLTGDPEPRLAIVDPAMAYLQLYNGFRGMPLFDSSDILDPHMRTSRKTAVLTYRLARRRAAATDSCNATQVYEKQTSGWRVIHSHWSEVKERQP